MIGNARKNQHFLPWRPRQQGRLRHPIHKPAPHGTIAKRFPNRSRRARRTIGGFERKRSVMIGKISIFSPGGPSNKDGLTTRFANPHPAGPLQSGSPAFQGEPVEPSADLSGNARKKSEKSAFSPAAAHVTGTAPSPNSQPRTPDKTTSKRFPNHSWRPCRTISGVRQGRLKGLDHPMRNAVQLCRALTLWTRDPRIALQSGSGLPQSVLARGTRCPTSNYPMRTLYGN